MLTFFILLGKYIKFEIVEKYKNYVSINAEFENFKLISV